MRILLVTHYYPEHRSGVEIVAGVLARRLAQRGAEIEWAASDGDPGKDSEGVRRLPARAWNISERRFGVPYPVWGPTALAGLGRAVQRCDVVHLHDALYLGNIAAYLYARRFRKPVVVTQHIGAIPYTSRLLRGLLGMANRGIGRLVLGGADRCVFISAQVREYFLRRLRFRQPPLYWPNGVDTTVFNPGSVEDRRAARARLGLADDRLVLLFVGRFVEKKGLRFLSTLARELPDFHWVFVGWGPENPATWGLRQVRCVGSQPQAAIADYYRASDLLVLPSVGEGFPLVVQEAMACGLPAFISTETAMGAPGVTDVLSHADLRLEAWREKLCRLARDPAELALRRKEVALFAQCWDWDVCAERYWQMFHDLVRSPHPR
jgi:glycosyltransferase involved in cell wall biosynthesis